MIEYLKELAIYRGYGFTPERAAKLAQAERDGRLVVPPPGSDNDRRQLSPTWNEERTTTTSRHERRINMDQLGKDLDRLVVKGMDSKALYKRVCKYLMELVAYRATGLTPERAAKLAQAERGGRLALVPVVDLKPFPTTCATSLTRGKGRTR